MISKPAHVVYQRFTSKKTLLLRSFNYIRETPFKRVLTYDVVYNIRANEQKKYASMCFMQDIRIQGVLVGVQCLRIRDAATSVCVAC